eukprot:s3997_g1.t5
MFGVARLAWVKRLSDEDKVDFLKTQMLFVENLKKQMQAKLWQKEPSCCAGRAAGAEDERRLQSGALHHGGCAGPEQSAGSGADDVGRWHSGANRACRGGCGHVPCPACGTYQAASKRSVLITFSARSASARPPLLQCNLPAAKMMPPGAMPGGGGQGVFVINKNAKRDQGRKAQLTNIQAGKTVAGIVRTTLGPRAMLKMLAEEMTKLCRKDGNLTSRVAYAGGTKVGEGGLVCYHNMEGKAGDAEELKSQSSVVSRVQADYGQLGHAEVVEMTLPEADFESFAGRFFEACPAGARRDVQDMGGELQDGLRTSPDNIDDGAEKYHQFHDDMLDKYGNQYHSLRRLDPMGGIVMTNDGNAILREVDVSHPAAKNMIELSRAQDEEVGDGTTSVIILAGELLGVAEPLIEKKLHPTLIVSGYMKALEDAQTLLKELAYPVDLEHPEALREIVRGSIDTKFASRFGTLISDLAIKAVKTVCIVKPDGRKEIDVKRFAKVEKIQGGELTDCQVLDGVMFNKDITHPRMRREIRNPRVVLLDCPLEYKKGESQTNVEITKEADWEKLLQQEEEEMRRVCDDILKVKPDLVITEKGVSDLAQHFLMKGGVSVIRRIRKTDNLRIARVTGAHICNRTEELQESMVGTKCGRFKVSKVGEEYFTYLTECQDPKACTIVLRGATRDVLNEMERNLQDAFAVARNIILEPLLLPGGGAVEMELAARLKEKSKSIEGSRQYAYKAVGEALEVIPRSLAHNCGADVVRAMTDLRARHAATGNAHIGIDGKTGKVADVKVLSIFDTFAVKQQTLRTSIEAAAMLLRIDDIISGISKKKRDDKPSAVMGADDETFGDSRDGGCCPSSGAVAPSLPLPSSAAFQARARGGSATVHYPFSNRSEYIDKLHQCAQAGDAERAETWFADMEAAGFKHDLQAYNILTNVYAVCGAVDSVDEVLETMSTNACLPDEYTLSSAIRSCERRADVQRAEAYVQQMSRLGVLPNHAVYNALLEVCAAAADVAGASNVLADMQNQSVRKDTVTYNTALSVAAKAGASQIAATWFHQMTSAGLQPDAHSHAAVGDGCIYGKQRPRTG